MTSPSFPGLRMRRNRRTPWLRDLVREARLSPADLIWPVFVQEENGSTPIPSMPGVERLGPDRIVDAVGHAAELGIPAVVGASGALSIPDGATVEVDPVAGAVRIVG